MPKVWRGVGVSELFKLRNANQRAIEMTYIEKFWRDATAADVSRVMAGETVEARFRYGALERWVEGLLLAGWTKDNRYPWLDESRSGWTFCQVYAPPQWYLDKPEPGEGYRLLAKFPDEALQPGDEAFEASGRWSTSYLVKSFGVQVEGVWYRRRIEQPKPEPKHYVLQVGDTAETGNGFSLIVTTHGVEVS